MGCISQKKKQIDSKNYMVTMQGPETILFSSAKEIQTDMNKFNQTYTIVKEMENHSNLNKVYLLKMKVTLQSRILRKTPINSLSDIKIFEKQLRIFSLINHPNIVQLNEVYKDNENYYVITEYLEGQSLLKAIQQNKINSEQIAAHIMKNILEALIYLHSLNIVHGNITFKCFMFTDKVTSNLKITHVETWTYQCQNEVNQMHLDDLRNQNVYFRSPEVLKKSHSNLSSDIWSAGIILFYMISGRFPFSGQNKKQVQQAIMRGVLNFDGTEWSSASHNVRDLLGKMLLYLPQSRITAKDAIHHLWFKNHKKPVRKIGTFVLYQLTHFKTNSRIQEGILKYMIDTLVKLAEKEKLAKIFKEMDINNDGKLSREELIEGYMRTKKVNKLQCELEVSKILNNLDKDHNGYIDFTEFLQASVNKLDLLSKENLIRTFRVLDQDGNGKISVRELESQFKGCGIKGVAIENLVDEMDADGDHLITFAEFEAMMKQLNIEISQ